MNNFLERNYKHLNKAYTMRTKYFEACRTLDEVKALYKQLALLHHPDRGGRTATMQEINLEYESIKNNPHFRFYKEKEESQKDFTEFPEIISQIIGFKGITIEMCSNWIWLSGATYRYSKELKKIGFFFAGEKKLWYWRPHDYKSANRTPRDMSYIRKKYGSDIYPLKADRELVDKT